MVAMKQLGNFATKFFQIKAKRTRTYSNAQANQLSCELCWYNDWRRIILWLKVYSTYETSSSQGIPSFPPLDWEKEEGSSPAPRKRGIETLGTRLLICWCYTLLTSFLFISGRGCTSRCILSFDHLFVDVDILNKLQGQDYFKNTQQLKKCVWVNLNPEITSLNFRVEK